MGVLDGLSVIEVASSAPASVCGMMLSDLGAEVTVIEAPHADAGRPRPEDICNRGKRSVTLDLHQPDGLETLLKLVEQADVLVEGVGPGAAEKLGFGPDACHLRCPSLVYGRASGWGQTVKQPPN